MVRSGWNRPQDDWLDAGVKCWEENEGSEGDTFGLPSGMTVQLAQDGVVAVFEHEVELSFTTEHFDQIHQVAVFQLLQRHITQRRNVTSERKSRLKKPRVTFKTFNIRPGPAGIGGLGGLSPSRHVGVSMYR